MGHKPLRAAPILVNDRGSHFVDEHIVLDVCHELMLEQPTLELSAGYGKSQAKRRTRLRR